MVLTNNLTRSLSREEMSDVDVQVLKGVVYISLSDNMLYKSGSYEISDKASATLGKIAKINIINWCLMFCIMFLSRNSLGYE